MHLLTVARSTRARLMADTFTPVILTALCLTGVAVEPAQARSSHFGPMVSGDNAFAFERYPLELARLSQDAFAVVHLRPAHLWQSEIGTQFRLLYARKAVDVRFGIGKPLVGDLVQVESVSLILPSQNSIKTLPMFTAPALPRPDRKDPEVDPKRLNPTLLESAVQDKPKPIPPAPIDPVPPAFPGAQDDVPLEMQNLVIVTLYHACDRPKVIEAVLGEATERKHGPRRYFVSKSKFGPTALFFVTNHIYVVATGTARIMWALDRLAQIESPGAFDAAVDLVAQRYPLVAGVNLAHPEILELKKKIAADIGSERTPLANLRPLLEANSFALAVSPSLNLHVHARLGFADARQAAEAAPAVRDGLDLLRLMVLSRLRQDLRAAAAENAVDGKELLFLSLLVQQAESALRGVSVRRHGASVHVHAEGSFDITDLRLQAEAIDLGKLPGK